MLGVVRCPKCKLARGVELSAAKATCPSCGRELHPRKMKPLCSVDSVSDLPAAVQAANIRGNEKEVPPVPPKKIRRSPSDRALAALAQPRTCEELAAALELEEEDAQLLLDKLAENGAVLRLRDGTYLAISPAGE